MRALPAAAAAAAASLAYAVAERHHYRLSERRVPVAGVRGELTVLHLSDTHLSGRNRRLRAWLDALPERLGELPDLVLATGDLIEDNAGIEPLAGALARLDARLGRFYVLGSHDVYQSTLRGHLKYVTGRRDQVRARPAATDVLESALRSKGWVPLMNDTTAIDSPVGRIRLTGVDDPYLRRHRTGHIERAPDDAVAIGLMHAPDAAVVSAYALAGYDVALAGHTHGGQVRVPFAGALVTNCSLPVGLARGLAQVGSTWLHVSPGLGTGRYTPIRFACPAETTLLRIGRAD